MFVCLSLSPPTCPHVYSSHCSHLPNRRNREFSVGIFTRFSASPKFLFSFFFLLFEVFCVIAAPTLHPHCQTGLHLLAELFRLNIYLFIFIFIYSNVEAEGGSDVLPSSIMSFRHRRSHAHSNAPHTFGYLCHLCFTPPTLLLAPLLTENQM